MSEPIDLAKKLHALSQRGIGGEKSNAQRMLGRLMEQHGISWHDVNQPVRVERVYKYTSKTHRHLIGQVIVSVWAEARVTVITAYKELFADLSAAEHVEVLLKIDHYWKLYQQEQDLFLEAFIRRNDLVRHIDHTNSRIPTAAEIQRMRRVAAMSQTISAEAPNKRIGPA